MRYRLKSNCGPCTLDFGKWPIVFQALVVGHFSLFGSATLVLEQPSPVTRWIFVLWKYNFSTGTAVSGHRMDFRSLVVQL